MTLRLIFIPIMLFAFECIVYSINRDALFFDELGKNTLLMFVVFFIFYFVASILRSFKFKIIFSDDLYVVDGYIYKTHRFTFMSNGKNTYIDFGYPILFAKARCDGSTITTDWIPYPSRYAKVKDRKVKIFVIDNKGVDFYI